MKVCIAQDCNREVIARQVCRKHYHRLRKYGDLTTNLAPKGIPLAERFWRLVAIAGPTDCWEWTGARNREGYGMFTMRKAVSRRSHRVSFYLTHGHWPQPACLHSCDNPPCVNPAHLREGTKAENSRDAIERSRRPRKFSDELLLLVKNSPEPNRVLARRYGIDPSHVSRVKRFWEPGKGMQGRK